jgi:hypothetical protein
MTKAAAPILLLTLGVLAACGTNTQEKAATGAGGGIAAGALIAGPVGALAGAAVGAGAGTAVEKEKTADKTTHTASRPADNASGMSGSTAPATTAGTPAVERPKSGSGYAYGDQ